MTTKKTDKKSAKKQDTKKPGSEKLKVKRLTVSDVDQDVRGGSDTNCQAKTIC